MPVGLDWCTLSDIDPSWAAPRPAPPRPAPPRQDPQGSWPGLWPDSLIACKPPRTHAGVRWACAGPWTPLDSSWTGLDTGQCLSAPPHPHRPPPKKTFVAKHYLLQGIWQKNKCFAIDNVFSGHSLVKNCMAKFCNECFSVLPFRVHLWVGTP